MAGATPSNTISFTTVNAIPTGGKIKITYGSDFDVSGANGATCSTMDGSFATAVSGQVVTITRSAGTSQSAATESCTVAGIKNPAVSGSTGTYTITTTDSSDSTIDTDAAVTADTITAAALASTNVEPPILVAGSTGAPVVSFTTTNPIPITGKIKVTFPTGFDVSGANGASCSTMDGSFATGVSGQVVTITRSAGSSQSAAAETCSIGGVKTPAVSGSTGTYTISTTNSSDAVIDTDAAVTADTITAGALSATNVEPVSLAAGTTGSVTVSLTTANPITSDGKIKITFGSGYDVSGANGATCSTMDGSFATGVSGQVVTITRSAGSSQSAAAESCTIAGIRNPQITGSTGTYTITTTNTSDTTIDTDAAVTADTITPGVLTSTNVAPATLVAKANGTATVTFTTVNPIPVDGKIKVTFGAGFNVSGATGGTCSTMDGSFATSVSGQVVTLTRSGGGIQTADSESCTIGTVINPTSTGSTGTYTITTTNSADTTIDQDSAVAADTIIKGTLTIAIGGANPSASVVAPTAGNLALLQFSLTTSAEEAIRIDSIAVTPSGTINETTAALTECELWVDNDSDGVVDDGTGDTELTITGAPKAFAANNGVETFTITGGYSMAASSAKVLLFSCDLNGNGAAAQTLIMSLAANTDVGATGSTSTLTPNYSGTPAYTGGTKTINSPPVVDAGAHVTSITETESLVLSAASTPPTATDVNSQTLTYTWSLTDSASGKCTLSNTSQLIATINTSQHTTNYNCTAQLSVTDGVVASAVTDSITVTVAADNDAPTGVSAGSDQSLISNAGPVTLTAVAATEPEGQTLTYTWSETADTGNGCTLTDADTSDRLASVAITQTATFTCTMRVSVSDGTTAVTDDMVINVTASNQTPVANAGVDQTVNDSVGTVTLNGTGSSDADTSQTLTYAWSETADAQGVCSLSGATSSQPTVTVTNGASSTTCTYSLTVNDGIISSSADSMTLTITGDNDAPVISGVYVDETDASTGSADPTGLTSLTPVFSVAYTDGEGNAGSKFCITVENDDDENEQVWVSDNAACVTGTSFTAAGPSGDLLANVSNNSRTQDIDYQIEGAAGNETAADLSWCTNYTVRMKIFDTSGSVSNEASTSFKTDCPPVLADVSTVTATEGGNASVTLTNTDADTEFANFSCTSASLAAKGIAVNGALTNNGNNTATLSLTSLGNTTYGTYPVTCTATDPNNTALTSGKTFNLIIANNNQAPVLTAIGAKTAYLGGSLSFTVSATDADTDDSLTYLTNSLVPGMKFDPATHLFTWTPIASQLGAHQVTFMVIDNAEGKGNSSNGNDSEIVTITVARLIPTVDAGLDQSILEGYSTTLTGVANGGNVLTYAWSIVSGPGSLLNSASAQATFVTTDVSESQQSIVQLVVTNEYGEFASDTLPVTTLDKSNTPTQTSDKKVIGKIGDDLIYETTEEGSDSATLKLARATRVNALEIRGKKIILEGYRTYRYRVDGDGRLVISDPMADSRRGRVYFFQTAIADLPAVFDLNEASVRDGSYVRTVSGNSSGDMFGNSIDVGSTRTVISAPGANRERGLAYVYDNSQEVVSIVFGSEQRRIRSVRLQNYYANDARRDLFFSPEVASDTSSTQLAATTSSRALFLLRDAESLVETVELDQTEPNLVIQSGTDFTATTFGDVNGDGRQDLIASSEAAGRVYVYFGSDNPPATRTTDDADIEMVAGQDSGGFGHSVVVQDVTGDGVDDVVIGSPEAGSSGAGRIDVVIGRSDWDNTVDMDTDTNTLKVAGMAGQALGGDLTLVDYDGDGNSDIVSSDDTTSTILNLHTSTATTTGGNEGSAGGGAASSGASGGCSLVLGAGTDGAQHPPEADQPLAEAAPLQGGLIILWWLGRNYRKRAKSAVRFSKNADMPS